MITAGKRGFLFTDANYPAFKRLTKELKPDLPPCQATHALRHSFATHFMINGGIIITIQRILAHSRIEQTMTYVHFPLEYLQDAVTLNPLSGGTEAQSVHILSTLEWFTGVFSGLACHTTPYCAAESSCCKRCKNAFT